MAMSMSMQNILNETKFPFLFALSVLLICVTVLLLTNDTATLFPYLSPSDLKRSTPDLYPFSNVTVSSPPEKSSVVVVAAPSKNHTVPLNDSLPFDKNPPQSLDDDNGSVDDVNVSSLNVKWERCKGPVAVDYIPCLDNMKAIKKLKSRRHTEHRERHCPNPSPRCLVPLPKLYEVPLPWLKSRDMVRLIQFDLV